MRILFLLSIDIFSPGPSVHLLKDIIHETLARGYDVDIISKDNGNSKNNTLGADEARIGIYKIKFEENKNNWFKRYLGELQYLVQCSKLFKNLDYDVVFLQSCNVAYFAVKLIKKYLNTKILYNVQDIFPHNLKLSGNLPLQPILFPIFSYLQRRAYIQSDELITISRDMKELLEVETKWKTPISVVYNWGYQDKTCIIPDSENIFIKKCVNEYNLRKDVCNIVYAGNIGVVQNVELILSAAKAIKDNNGCHFWFIGEGARKRNIVNEAETYNLENVSFLSFQDESLASYIYSMADINIIPLQKGVIRTALPSKTPACLASGRSIIACIEKDSELADILRATDGCFVVDNSNEKELIDTIIFLSTKGRLLYEHRDIALRQFSVEIGPQKYVDIIERVHRTR